MWVLLLCVAGAVMYYYPRFSQTAAQDKSKAKGKGGEAGRPIPVVAAMSRKGDMPVYLNGLGSVTAFNTVTVRTRVDGEIVKVAFTEGQFVKEGDLVAEIDPRPFQVQLEQAEGQLATIRRCWRTPRSIWSVIAFCSRRRRFPNSSSIRRRPR